MGAKRQPPRFGPKGSEPKQQPAAASGGAASGPPKPAGAAAKRNRNQAAASLAIPAAVANRMARRIALATGLPSLLGMTVFVASYLLVSRHILDIPPSATLLASGSCFLLGVLGLSYGVLSASWEEGPGSLLGTEQIGLNIGRLKASLRALRQGTGP